ncbi:MAG: molybdopterin-dependent oxidoreductase [Acidimicrobiales bacterium]
MSARTSRDHLGRKSVQKSSNRAGSNGSGEPVPVTDAAGPPPGQLSAGKPIGRRLFLGIIGLGGLGVVFGNTLQRIVGAIVAPFTNKNGSGLGALIPGANRFRLYTVTGSFPDIPTSSYSLRVEGLVEHPLELTFDDLRAMPRTELVLPFQCVTGWRVPDVHWAGVRLADLIDRAGPGAGAHAVEFTSYDGIYSESLTLDQARRSDVIVAYEMLGGPITSEHGGPVRLYVAPMYGYKSAKWLRSISLVSLAIPGFWEQEGYAINAWVGRSNGRNDAPIA